MHNDDASPVSDSRRMTTADRGPIVTPLDMRQAKFASVMRGYDRQEVMNFMTDAAEGFDQALRENERLRQEVARLEGSLSHFRDLEGSLKNTLLSAQKLADDMRDGGTQDAARIVREAEGRAEMILQKAQARLEDTQREIDGLRLKRRDAETNIEATISALKNALEYMREQDQRERQDKVLAHRPRFEVAEPLETRTA